MKDERSLRHIDLNEDQLLALVKRPFPECKKLDAWRPLSGGALNTTYQVVINHHAYVIRIYARGKSFCKTENAIYDRIHETVSTPKLVYSNDLHEPWAYALFEFVSGKHPYEVSVEEKRDLSQAIGQTLASIHAFSFPSAGLFHEGMNIEVPFAQGSSPYYEKAVSVLSTSRYSRKHLGEKFSDQALTFMEKHQDFFPVVNNNVCLTHSDFKPVNLIYQAGTLYVLDWEFAHAGIGILDFSLILRERDRFPLDLDAIAEGYKAFGGKLPDEWYRSALITDFVNIATLLDSPAERPKLCKQLRQGMQNTMDKWNLHP